MLELWEVFVFPDWENYKEVDDKVKIQDYDIQYEQGRLELLSTIELNNLKVEVK